MVYVLCFCGFKKRPCFLFSSWLPIGRCNAYLLRLCFIGGGKWVKAGAFTVMRADLLQLRYGASPGEPGRRRWFCYSVYLRLCTVQPRVERDAPGAASSCSVYSEQSVLYSVWGRIDDTLLGHHINSRQKCRHQKCCNPEISQRAFCRILLPTCQIPLADKPRRVRHPISARPEIVKITKHLRHFPPESIQVMDIIPSGFVK